MANYYATTRTNYFRAENPELLLSTIEAAARRMPTRRW